MCKMIILGAVLVFFFLLQGCTIHFKSKDTELDVERQRVQHYEAYELELVRLFDG